MLGLWEVEEPTWVGRNGGGSSTHQSAVRVANLARTPGHRDVDLDLSRKLRLSRENKGRHLRMGKITSGQQEREQTLVRPAEKQTQAAMRPQHQHSRDPEERDPLLLFILPASQNEFLGARWRVLRILNPRTPSWVCSVGVSWLSLP